MVNDALGPMPSALVFLTIFASVGMVSGFDLSTKDSFFVVLVGAGGVFTLDTWMSTVSVLASGPQEGLCPAFGATSISMQAMT